MRFDSFNETKLENLDLWPRKDPDHFRGIERLISDEENSSRRLRTAYLLVSKPSVACAWRRHACDTYIWRHDVIGNEVLNDAVACAWEHKHVLLNQGNLFEMMWSFSLPGMASLMSKYGHVRDWPWWIQSRQNSSWRTTTPKNKCLLNIYYIECACAPRELLCDLHCCCLLLPLPSRNPSPHPRRIALLFQNFKQISPSVII